jgi:hypothetical protein
MTAARGDSKPCTGVDCAGTMQFGRRGDNVARAPVARNPVAVRDVAMDVKGWVCNTDPDHFRQEG